MFPSTIYLSRREKLQKLISGGIIFFPGNMEVPFNYRSNTYHFRQDSSFSYFFGLNEPNLAGLIDVEENESMLFGNDPDLDDIIWMGPVPGFNERALRAGVLKTFTYGSLQSKLQKAIAAGRTIHFLPPYRGESFLELEKLVGAPHSKLLKHASPELIKAVIELRSVKDKYEISEIELMVGTAYDMHTTAMKMARSGMSERVIAGTIEGIAISQGAAVSFPVILSMNGETLHNHFHGNNLQKGRLLLTDAGAESELLYASDITRTVPVDGKFNQRQRDIYNIVLAANLKAIAITNPNTLYKDVHLAAARVITEGLKNLGLMKGDIDEAVSQGAHALFFPHGLGHMLGMDVHDMEGLGETLVGYNENITRSDQFGLAYLRFAKKPKPGYVLTDEPGIYFIPALIDQWRNEKKFEDFINYEKLESYKDFGGIRIEDDILVTEDGCRVLGKPIPKSVEEIEDLMA